MQEKDSIWIWGLWFEAKSGDRNSAGVQEKAQGRRLHGLGFKISDSVGKAAGGLIT